MANYQRYTGGAIGEVGNGHHRLKNVDVVNTTVSSLWGDFDASLGGLIGGKWGHTYTDVTGENGHKVSVYMTDCDSAAIINAYNDVTSAYQWYAYRRSGMLVGNSDESKTVNGRTEATATWLTASNCTVQYGAWANYTYCQFTDMTYANARYPWVRVQGSEFNNSYSNPRYGRPTFNGKTVNWDTHTETYESDHKAGDKHELPITFYQLYGGGQGCYGGNAHVEENLGVEVITDTKSVTKFENYRDHWIESGDTVKLGELFAVAGLGTKDPVLQSISVKAYVSPVDPAADVRATLDDAPADWKEKSLTFTGSGWATVTIQDYYYCEPTTIQVYVCSDHTYGTDGYCTDPHCNKYIHDLYVYDFDLTHPAAATNANGDPWSKFDLYLYYNIYNQVPDDCILIGSLRRDNIIANDGAFHEYDFTFTVPELTLSQHRQYVYFDPYWKVLSRQMDDDLSKIAAGTEVTVLLTMKTTINEDGSAVFEIDTIRIVEKCNHTDGNSCSDYVEPDSNVIYDYDYTYISGNVGRTAIADSAAYKGKAHQFTGINLAQDNFNLFLSYSDSQKDESGNTVMKESSLQLAAKDKSLLSSAYTEYVNYAYTFKITQDMLSHEQLNYVYFGSQSRIKNVQMAQDLKTLLNTQDAVEVTVVISMHFTNDGTSTNCTFYVDRMQIVNECPNSPHTSLDSDGVCTVCGLDYSNTVEGELATYDYSHFNGDATNTVYDVNLLKGRARLYTNNEAALTNGMIVYLYDGVNSNKLYTIEAADIKTDEVYHTYDLTFTVPTDLTNFTHVYFSGTNWNFRSEQLAKDLADLKGQTVTLRISMKITGTLEKEQANIYVEYAKLLPAQTQ